MWYFLVAVQLTTIVCGVVMCVWGINGVLTIERSRRVADSYLLTPTVKNPWFWRNPFAYVEDIYNYHSPFTLRGWFGFRHWFKPYKRPEHTYGEEMDSIPLEIFRDPDSYERRSSERKHSIH